MPNISPTNQRQVEKYKYLFGKGVNVSILSPTSKSFDIGPTAVTLFAANGSPVKVIKHEKRIKLNLGLRRNIFWSYVIVTSSVIGSDFIKHDLRRNQLADNTTGTISELKSATYNETASIRNFDATSSFTI